MLFTASTVKDTPENVEFFVAANLASGVDHMFVFLDAPRAPGQREVAEMLAGHPHVTCLATDRRSWWAEARPAGLNVRQRTNANWVRHVLAPLPWASWLFHVDGDEVVRVDRDALAAVPADVDAVRLLPLEAVSEWDGAARPTRFKRLLDDAELNLLHVLGILTEPTNQAYFHGHVMGKSGVRPGSGLGLSLHHALDADGVTQPRHEDPRLRVLHYDAPTGVEFVRKWTALAEAGPVRYRADRAPAARALRTLVTRDLDPETRERYLRRIYESTTRDDVAALSDLRLLEDVDPTVPVGSPQTLSPDQAGQLAARVEELAGLPKADFHLEESRPGQDAEPAGAGARLLRRARRR